ncbi:isoprenyl transferase [Parasphingopyxis lamellibrachiae]|uniref:isoprenyl transferase n=1 Tax=Parasphingopyxis lamellibrachiae TaxID=680125 RepID=UPI0024826C3E|nr:isoprenyl transferase [Parasphingopyxis lamellibrachiae]
MDDAAAGTGSGGDIPRHVAIIMDGNGRWAQRRGLPRIAGHRKGIEAARAVVKTAGALGIEVLTLYAFSSENWSRPASEIADLMNLLRRFIRKELEALAGEGIRIRVIGNYQAFENDVVELIDSAIARTANNRKATLVVALNYGSQSEITDATRQIAADVQSGALAVGDITNEAIDARLSTHDLPPLDLLIRTSGEKRLSNFLLWQAAYAELLFTDTLWPDFGEDSLRQAIEEFTQRDRRYGGL